MAAATNAVATADVPPEGTRATMDDGIVLLSAILRQHTLVGYQLKEFNDLIEHGLARIMRQMFHVERLIRNTRTATEEDRKITTFKLDIQFSDVVVSPPTYGTYTRGLEDMLPNRARTSMTSYAGRVSMVIHVTITATTVDRQAIERTAKTSLLPITRMPIMVGSSACHTAHMSRRALMAVRESPDDTGGYFIVSSRGHKANELTISSADSTRFNTINVHRRQGRNEEVRSDIISQPGWSAYENSSQLVVRLMRSGAITVSVTSVRLQLDQMPLVLLFRLFGMVADTDTVDTVLAHEQRRDTTVYRVIEEILARGLYVCTEKGSVPYAPLIYELDRSELASKVGAIIATYVRSDVALTTNPDAVRYLHQDLLGTLDRVVLPHMGQTPETRINKLRFIGMMLHQMLLVHLEVLPPTDRDSFKTKRAFSGSVQISKVMKTIVNKHVVMPITRALRGDLENKPFDQITPTRIVEIVSGVIWRGNNTMGDELERVIVSSSRTREHATNQFTGAPTSNAARRQLPTHVLERKCAMHTVSALRGVTAAGAKAAKGSDRATKMRLYHPSHTGVICPFKSADTGETVGTNRELASAAILSMAEDAAALRAELLNDVDPLASVPPRAGAGRALVFVNGEWLGFARAEYGRDAPAAHTLALRYRDRRRRNDPRVSHHTTIECNYSSNRLEFWTETGRIAHPMLIVHNNRAAYDAACTAGAAPAVEFNQWVNFTHEHARAILAGRLTFMALLNTVGFIEYLTPEEIDNGYFAQGFNELYAAAHDPTQQFTHLPIPQGMISYTALISPLLAHTQPVRVTYETNQGRQACGWATLMWPFRARTRTFVQYTISRGVVSTLANNYVRCDGYNCMVAIMSAGGMNMEDSNVINQDSRQRGLFDGIFYVVVTVLRERNDSIGMPDRATTCDMKSEHNYSKLVNGTVPVGTRVVRGDVLVGRYARITRGAAASGAPVRYQFRDRSVTYSDPDPAVVDFVTNPQGAEGETSVLVRLVKERPMVVGDKGSSRAGNKFIVSSLRPQADMPYTEDGLTPDCMFNPHSMPGRMTIGQLLESALGLAGGALGRMFDGTALRAPTTESIGEALRAAGFRQGGYSMMYNPRTGRPIGKAICFGINTIQRLQKFVSDENYAVATTCATDNTTHQPLPGRGTEGGLRLGEMEQWCLNGQGVTSFQLQKNGPDSNGCMMYVCRRCCGMAGVVVRVDEDAGGTTHICRDCGPHADIVEVPTGRTSIVFRQELNSAGIDLRLGLTPHAYLPEGAQ